MGVLKSVAIDEIVKRGSIKDIDVLQLRAAYYQDGTISTEEAQLLFTVAESCPIHDTAWSPFFIEAITDYVVNQAQPEGYVTAENAEWLIGRIAGQGRIETKTKLELLVSVLEKARWSPVSLSKFALEQVKRAVIDGDGPLRMGAPIAPGHIGETDVELIRRLLYAFGGDGNVAVTKAEAEVLFDINDALAGATPDPAWCDLFVKAIANVLMASSGYAVPSREEALRRGEWLDERGELAPGLLIGAVCSQGLASVWSAYHEQSPEEQALARLEQQRIEIITNEQITPTEADWLAARLGRDGRLTATETALLAYLKGLSGALPPALAALADKHRSAAA